RLRPARGEAPAHRRCRAAAAGGAPDPPPAALGSDRLMPGGCVFCAIVTGETPAAVVLDEPELVGFLDTRPVFKGHVLLVPRRHVETLPDLPAVLRDPFLEAAQRLSRAMVTALGAQGSFVAMNNTVSQ